MKKSFGLLLVLLVIGTSVGQDLFPLTIIHLNDIHARFDETNIYSNTCKESDECVGGYARVVTKVKELQASRPNPIYLNVGDNFQGTLWYNIHRWNVTSHMLNLLVADAMTIGNHEFDHGIDGLVPFLDTIKSPVLVSNIDDSLEPSMQGKLQKSMVIMKEGRSIGIVGVTTTMRSNWGNVNILPEVDAVKAEVQKLTDNGIKIIIVLSHCGLEVDREIAKHGGPISIIVGGHSHSFLFSGLNPPSVDIPVDSYPTIEKQDNGHEVLIVQAYAYAKYLGDITLYFDDDGIIQNFVGQPIFLSHDVVKDASIEEELKPWKEVIDQLQNRVVGNLNYDLSSSGCYNKECGMGAFTADSYLDAFLDGPSDGQEGWTSATICLTVPGGIRSGLVHGEIFYGDLVTTTPFENLLYSVELQGKVIRKAMEFSVSNEDSLMLLQVAGLKITFDMKREAYDRITELKVLCRICDVPRYEPIDDEQYYRVVMPSFLADGGDGFTMIGENAKNILYGPRDIDALNSYVEKFSPFTLPPTNGRITFI